VDEFCCARLTSSSSQEYKGDVHVKGKIFRFLAFAILASPLAAHAQNLVGDWQGSVLYPPGNVANSYGLDLNMDFLSEKATPLGFSFTGELEVTCMAGGAPKDCGTGGFHTFTGILSNGVLEFTTNGAFSGAGILSSGGNQINGGGLDLSGTPIGFEVSRVAAPEINAAAAASGLSLLAGGLLVLRGRRSMKLDSVAA
jgi:hypothetical protein